MNKIIWEIPLKTVSEANCSEHWRVKSKRHKLQQFFIRSLFKHEAKSIGLPCYVSLTRLSPRLLDDDNLRMAFKWIRDEISECLIPLMRKTYINKQGNIQEIKGRADCDPRISWGYNQQKSRKMGIRIEINSAVDAEPLGKIYVRHEDGRYDLLPSL